MNTVSRVRNYCGNRLGNNGIIRRRKDETRRQTSQDEREGPFHMDYLVCRSLVFSQNGPGARLPLTDTYDAAFAIDRFD